MSLKRRNFLKFISLAGFVSPLGLLASCSHQKFYNPDQDIVFGGGKFMQNDALRHVLAMTNLSQQESQLIDIDFLAHGIIIDPANKTRLLAFEKNAPNAAAIDLTTNTTSQKISTSPDKYFNGHAAFNKKGNTLFCVETYADSKKGSISIRDGKSLKAISELPTYGKNPHDCRLIDDDKTLVVSNTGGISNDQSPSSITYIDVQSEKLIERVTLDTKKLNTGHFAIADDASLVITSAPRADIKTADKPLGGVSIRSGDNSISTMAQPDVVIDQLHGEALSVVIDNRHKVAAVTHPDANLITFWSVDKKQLVKAMSVPQPRGITLSIDGKSFIVSYGIDTSVVTIDTKHLTADPASIVQPSYISGEHLYNWSETLRKIMPTNVYT